MYSPTRAFKSCWDVGQVLAPAIARKAALIARSLRLPRIASPDFPLLKSSTGTRNRRGSAHCSVLTAASHVTQPLHGERHTSLSALQRPQHTTRPDASEVEDIPNKSYRSL